MAATARLLASGSGWRASEVVCNSGPRDRPFEEWHEHFCIAPVTRGTFRYRSRQGEATMAPGAVLLGNPGTCFECGHEHAAGDRCISFHFEPEFLETIVADVPGVRRARFDLPRLPPAESLAPLLAAAEAARDENDREELEEIALRLAAAVSVLEAEAERPGRAATPRDRRRVSEAVRRIEEQPDQPTALAELAREAAMSPYHFLRTFRDVTGMTPHRFLLQIRLQRASERLRRSDDTILSVALDAGFNDLSTFNRRFKRIMGTSPGEYRTRRKRAG